VIRARPEGFRLETTSVVGEGQLERSIYCADVGGARYVATIATPAAAAPRGARALTSTVYRAGQRGLCSGAANGATAVNDGAPGKPPPGPQLVRPTGVAGCIFRNLPDQVNRDAVMAVLSHADPGKVLREPVSAVAPRCTGQPYSASDADLVGAVLSLYQRIVAASTLGREVGLAQRQLDAAWASATPADKAPYLAAARSFISPGSQYAPPPPGAAATFQERLNIPAQGAAANVPALLHMYYSATALSEVSEAGLAARGVAAPDR
jgi:hypothetical protein